MTTSDRANRMSGMTRVSLFDRAVVAAPILIVIGLAAGFFLFTQGTLRSALNRRDFQELSAVFPQATRFSDMTGDPPRAQAFVGTPRTDEERLIGWAFYTDEVEPYERGYDGPIRMLVGLDLTGRITRVHLVEHHEPYGYFSIDPVDFREQFAGKGLGDRFRVGDDIDAISRATITVVSATRAIANSARRVARAGLTEQSRVR